MARHRPSPVLLGAAALALALHACNKAPGDGQAASGLLAGRTYASDAVATARPARLFTRAGEVTDAGVLARYLAAHPDQDRNLKDFPEARPAQIRTDGTATVLLDGLYRYTAQVTGAAFEMRQQDTGKTRYATAQASISSQYQYERQFQALRDAVLEPNDSHLALQRIDSQSYASYESFHIRGTYGAETVVIPYTYVASGTVHRSYPLAVRATGLLRLPADDTLLVQEGTVTFRLRP